MKTTVKASSDIALIKYWGKKDEVLRLPENGSISMKLDGLDTITTIDFLPDLDQDDVTIQNVQDLHETKRVSLHLDRIRSISQTQTRARVVSYNTFPKSTGLSSSSSSFAALTVAAAEALNLRLSQKELSILARQGSGSACRCVCGGFVEWLDGERSEDSYATTIFDSSHWQLRDVVVIVDEGKKLVSSTEGHESARSSPFYQVRLQHINSKIRDVKKYLAAKDFTALGTLVEAEALEFHSILLTSSPALIAWYPGTVEVMHLVRKMRQEGIEAYFTINTGFNVHVLTEEKYREEVKKRLTQSVLVKQVLEASVGEAPEIIQDHLF